MKRRFCIGDIHGAYKAMQQVFGMAGFDYNKDQLVCLGDVADGWPQVPECFDELLKIKNLVYIMGNHDAWLLDYFNTGKTPGIWTSQGGDATLRAYETHAQLYRGKWQQHKKLLEEAFPYYISPDNKLFVHGGFNWMISIEEQNMYDLTWDRDLFYMACRERTNKKVIVEYDEVFIGHTTTSRHDPSLKPVHASNLWNLDQGAGWEGKLTLMNIDTKEYYQSDIVSTLYSNEKGRR